MSDNHFRNEVTWVGMVDHKRAKRQIIFRVFKNVARGVIRFPQKSQIFVGAL